MNLIPWSPKVTGVSLPSVITSEDNKSYTIKARFPGMEKREKTGGRREKEKQLL